MCGISDFMAFYNLGAKECTQMTNIIRHRGPDDEGFVFFQDLSTLPRVCGARDTPDDAYQAQIAYAPKENHESAILLPKLAIFEEEVALRQKIAARYATLFASLRAEGDAAIQPPPTSNPITPASTPNTLFW